MRAGSAVVEGGDGAALQGRMAAHREWAASGSSSPAGSTASDGDTGGEFFEIRSHRLPASPLPTTPPPPPPPPPCPLVTTSAATASDLRGCLGDPARSDLSRSRPTLPHRPCRPRATSALRLRWREETRGDKKERAPLQMVQH